MHFTDNWVHKRVPAFNFDREQSLKTMQEVEQFLKANSSMTETLLGIVTLTSRIPNARIPKIASRRLSRGTSTVRYRQFKPTD